MLGFDPFLGSEGFSHDSFGLVVATAFVGRLGVVAVASLALVLVEDCSLHDTYYTEMKGIC